METFKKKVFDFTQSEERKFEGDIPTIIDYYAGWCGPCKMVVIILEDLSDEYEGKVDV